MTTTQVLEAAKALIADPERWTQGTFSRDKAGQPCRDPQATSWCLEGAILHVRPGSAYQAFDAIEAVVDGYINTFNDTHTHQEVMEAFTKAIERSREG